MSPRFPTVITDRQNKALVLSMGMVAKRGEEPMSDERRAEITADLHTHLDQLLADIAEGTHRAMVIITLKDGDALGLYKLGYAHDLQKLAVAAVKEAAEMAESIVGEDTLDSFEAFLETGDE